MCEVVASVGKVTEELLERLLPYIVEGLAAEAATDYRAATLMLLAELSSRTPLSQAFLSGESVWYGGSPCMNCLLVRLLKAPYGVLCVPMMRVFIMARGFGPNAHFISVCIP